MPRIRFSLRRETARSIAALRRAPGADHQQEAVEDVLQRHRVGHGVERRAVHHDVSVGELARADQAGHALGAEQLGAGEALAAGRQHGEARGRDRADGNAGGVTGEEVGDAADARHAEVALDRGLAQVGLQQQRAVLGDPRERGRQAERDRGLAFARPGAHDTDRGEALAGDAGDLRRQEAELLGDVVAAAEHGLLERLPGDGLRHARDQPHGVGVDHLLLDLLSASTSAS